MAHYHFLDISIVKSNDSTCIRVHFVDPSFFENLTPLCCNLKSQRALIIKKIKGNIMLIDITIERQTSKQNFYFQNAS